MASYYEPAGVMQIEVEQGPWDEEWDEDPYDGFVDNLPAEEILYAHCPKCFWWSSAPYWLDDPADLERAREYLRLQHREERPGCGGEMEFS